MAPPGRSLFTGLGLKNRVLENVVLDDEHDLLAGCFDLQNVVPERYPGRELLGDPFECSARPLFVGSIQNLTEGRTALL